MDDRSLNTADLAFRSIFKKSCDTVQKYGMHDMLMRGVLVGLSGGADSVMLLHFLKRYSEEKESFKILAVHINHMIRGDEADRDELFSRKLSEELGIEFISIRVDVPSLAKSGGVGLEEAARNARYSEFRKIIESRNDIFCIAVAHNSTDNAETCLFNILRGAGSRGASGISPVRDNILRPLIEVSKSDIIECLERNSIEYVTDSTNMCTDYSRNYIRHEILPKLDTISPSVENMFLRLSENLRADDSYLSELADGFLLNALGEPSRDELSALHPAVLVRVIKRMCASLSVSVSSVQVNKITQLLRSGHPFSVTLSGGARFVCEAGKCKVADTIDSVGFCQKVSVGITSIEGFDADIILSDTKIDKSFLNVYKKSISVGISSAIIVGDLYVRSKKDGDSVFYGGCTHKLKKMYNDKKIPPSKRPLIPVLADEKGVVWVPCCGVRDDCTEETRDRLYVAIGIGKSESLQDVRVMLPSEFDIY